LNTVIPAATLIAAITIQVAPALAEHIVLVGTKGSDRQYVLHYCNKGPNTERISPIAAEYYTFSEDTKILAPVEPARCLSETFWLSAGQGTPTFVVRNGLTEHLIFGSEPPPAPNESNLWANLILFMAGAAAASAGNILRMVFRPVDGFTRILCREISGRNLLLLHARDFSREFVLNDELLRVSRGDLGDDWYIPRWLLLRVKTLASLYERWKSKEIGETELVLRLQSPTLRMRGRQTAIRHWTMSGLRLRRLTRRLRGRLSASAKVNKHPFN
jgi:hypothetical protein